MRKKLLFLISALTLGLTAFAQAPKADLLDVVFNEDGTATDVSAMQNTVEVVGTPAVVKSSRYGINEACFKEATPSAATGNYYKIDYSENEAFKAALESGHSIEALVRFNLNGAAYESLVASDKEVKPFSSHQGGGTGLMVCKTNRGIEKDSKQEITFLPHVGGAYQYANSGIVPQHGVYYHLVGVWDKEAGEARIYIDGKLVYTNPQATGDLTHSSIMWFAIGGDPGSKGCETAFSGDVAIARVYGNALTADEVAALWADVEAIDTKAEEHSDINVPMVNGFYQLGTAQDLAWFANEVNKGANKINAQLTADIDFTNNTEMIGNGANYMGTFDGQGHTITVNYSSTLDRAGLFRYLDGATIQDLTVAGDITGTNSFTAGVAGGSINTPSYLLRVVSKVNIHSKKDGDNTFGGILGNVGGGATLESCIFAGTMDRLAKEDGSLYTAQNSGGLVGWCGSKVYFRNCLMLGKMDLAIGWNALFGRDGSNAGANATAINCYYNAVPECFEGAADAGYNSSVNGATLITEDIAKSGELCFSLNGNQTSINWYQNLGEDEMPTLDKTHKQVYANGHVSCAGEPIGAVTYSNDASGMQQDEHDYSFGVCTVCGLVNPDFCKQDADGYYQIATAEELVWFANTAIGGKKGLKAKLVDDIDMADYSEVFPMIGTHDNKFTDGTFDGQFHRISNLNINKPAEQYVGLFGCVGGNCDIRNIIVDKSCTFTGIAFMGIVGGTDGAGDVYMTNLGMEGTVVGSAQNCAGIYGCNMGSTATAYIDHCYVTGSITGSRESAAITGWMGGKGYLKNSWSIAEVDGHDANQPFGRNCVYTNCWTNIKGHTHAGVYTFDSAEEALTGELTYKMNGSSIESPVWFQTLGSDEYPSWDNTHGIVYKLDGFGDIHDAESFAEYFGQYGGYMSGLCDNTIATQSLLDEFAAMLENIPQASTLEEFLPTYKEHAAKLAEINTSAAAYAAYVEKLDYISNYLAEDDSFFGDDRDELQEYLTSDDEPSADFFSNGGAKYILETHTLTTEEIQAETQNALDLLQKAIANGYSIGSELTSMIQDPKFLEGAEPWDGFAEGSLSIAGVEGMNAIEAFKGNFDIYQTITGLRNGIYEVRVNGVFRCLPWQDNRNVTALFYANDSKVNLKNYFDEYQTIADAQDGVNCNTSNGTTDLTITDTDGADLGYVPQGPLGAAIHFNYGRYENVLVAKVTDGTLTIGVKNTGTGNANDWATFSNFRLFFQGDLEDASEAMDRTLAGMSDRAAMNGNYVPDFANFEYYPNYSQELKDKLAAAVEAIEGAVEPADKMALIATFSEIFEEMPASKRAYRAYGKDVETYYAAVTDMQTEGSIDADAYQKETALYETIWGKLLDGVYTTAEAEAEAELKSAPYYNAAFGVEPELVDGYYMLAEPGNYVWYMKYVNAGNTNVNAKMTADLDMAGIAMETICKATPYNGHFDGQGHKFSNVKITGTGIDTGMWGVAGNCTIENFVLDETCSIIGENYTAIVGGTETASVTCHINNVGNEGYVQGVKNTGAIFGCNRGGETAFVYVNNCYSTGTIDADNESGVLTGYLRYGGIYNSWSNAYISPTGYYTPANKPFALIYGETKNNWIVTEYELNADFDIKKCSADDVASGELCWRLNQYSGSEEPIWFQTLGKDAHPVLDPTHGIVAKDENGNLYNTTGINNVITDNDSDAIFDLQGRRVSKAVKGLYIVGNKKMLVK